MPLKAESAGKDMLEVRAIRDEVERRVVDLVESLKGTA